MVTGAWARKKLATRGVRFGVEQVKTECSHLGNQGDQRVGKFHNGVLGAFLHDSALQLLLRLQLSIEFRGGIAGRVALENSVTPSICADERDTLSAVSGRARSQSSCGTAPASPPPGLSGSMLAPPKFRAFTIRPGPFKFLKRLSS